MASTDASVRRRKLDPKEEAEKDGKVITASETEPIDSDEEKKKKARKSKKKSRKVEDEDEYDKWDVAVDVLRVLSFLFVVSCGLSYLISGGESFFWGMTSPPNYLKASWWKSKLVGPSYLV